AAQYSRPELTAARVPLGRLYPAEVLPAAPQSRDRDMILESTLPDGKRVDAPGIIPPLGSTPGRVRREAPLLGEHTDSPLESMGISEASRDELRRRGAI